MKQFEARYHDGHSEFDYAETIHHFVAKYPDARLYAPVSDKADPPREIE